jgi:citrate lyase subunit beta/citryl-CoA lyase
MMNKARVLEVDQVFLDLEDSVAAGAKEEARRNVVAALRSGEWGSKTRVVRINDCTTKWAYLDLITVVEQAGAYLDCIMVPKVENAGQVAFVDNLLTQVELTNGLEVGRIGLELQIESAAGLVNAEVILAESRRVESFIFGPGDMAASLGMPSLTVGEIHPDYPGDHWHWVLFTVLVHARKAGVQAIDGPYAKIRDLEGFTEVAHRSRALGFDGKWVLHPDQIGAANKIFGITQAQYERAVDISEAMVSAAETELRGAVMFGEEMIDEASRKLAEGGVSTGERQGLAYRQVPPEVPFHERAVWRSNHAVKDSG